MGGVGGCHSMRELFGGLWGTKTWHQRKKMGKLLMQNSCCGARCNVKKRGVTSPWAIIRRYEGGRSTGREWGG